MSSRCDVYFIPEALIEKMKAGCADVLIRPHDHCAADPEFWELFRRG